GRLPASRFQHRFDRGMGQCADACGDGARQHGIDGHGRQDAGAADRIQKSDRQLSALAKNPGDIYISIVPFAKDVNVGASNYNQSWIDWTAWDAANQTCSSSSGGGGGNGKNRKGNGGGGGGSVTCTPNNHNTWNGCVWDRDQNNDTLITAPVASDSSTLFPAEQWSACPIALMPLSYNWTGLKSLVDSMTPNGNTNQAIGMAWAWQSLAQTSALNRSE